MGTAPSVAAPAVEPAIPTPVTLNVYNVGTSQEVQAINKVLRVMGTGAFHCGVEVHGAEWSYRGARFPLPGVFSRRPRDCEGHVYSESVFMGITLMSRREVHDVLRILTWEWPGWKYDLLKFNCCHFCEKFCEVLGVGSLPAWITSLAGTGASIVDTGDYIGARTRSFGSKVDTALCGTLLGRGGGGGSPKAAAFSCASCLCLPVSEESVCCVGSTGDATTPQVVQFPVMLKQGI